MKKLFFLIFTLFITSAFFAQTLDEVLQKYYKAVNQEKLNTVQTMTIKGKVAVQGMELPMNMYQKRPNKLRTEATFQGLSVVTVYDGENGWTINPFMGQAEAQPLQDAQIEQTKDQADIDGYFVNYEKKGLKLELMPTETMDSILVYNITVTKPNGDVIYNYLDTRTGLIVKIKSKVNIQGTMTDAETCMNDYKTIDDLVYPGNIESKAGGQTMAKIIIDSVEFNKDLDDSLFVKPVKK
jgi:outer membrane lipoprotein-sorting protein